MKVVDIADEIFRELSEPSTLSIPAIAYWVRSNVGELNNYLNTSFRVSHQTFEIAEEVDVTGRQPSSFNSAVDSATLELQFEEKAVLKKMYNVHYYDQQVRSTLGAASNDPVVEVDSDGSKVRKPLLEALDIDYQRADEAGDASKKTEIATKKQALRDVTNSTALNDASSATEVRAVWDTDVLGTRPSEHT